DWVYRSSAVLIFRKTFASIVRSMLIPVLLLIVPWGVAGCEGGVQSSGVSHPPVKGSQTLTQVHLPTRLNTNRPVLAFYYMWYTPSTWCLCHMSDLPTTRYDSSDDATIARQVRSEEHTSELQSPYDLVCRL